MKKKRFADGGYTDQEASDLMKNDVVPKRSIYLTSDEPATPQSAADTAAENAALAREAAQEARRSAPRVAPKPDMVSDQISRNVPAPRTAMQTSAGRGNENDYSMNEQEGSGRGTSTRAPSRGSYDRPGPVGGAIGGIKGLMDTLADKHLLAIEKRKREKLLRERPLEATPMKKGGAVKAKRGDGIAQRGKTKGRFV